MKRQTRAKIWKIKKQIKSEMIALGNLLFIAFGIGIWIWLIYGIGTRIAPYLLTF